MADEEPKQKARYPCSHNIHFVRYSTEQATKNEVFDLKLENTLLKQQLTAKKQKYAPVQHFKQACMKLEAYARAHLKLDLGQSPEDAVATWTSVVYQLVAHVYAATDILFDVAKRGDRPLLISSIPRQPDPLRAYSAQDLASSTTSIIVPLKPDWRAEDYITETVAVVVQFVDFLLDHPSNRANEGMPSFHVAYGDDCGQYFRYYMWL